LILVRDYPASETDAKGITSSDAASVTTPLMVCVGLMSGLWPNVNSGINPAQCEVLTMKTVRVMGHDIDLSIRDATSHFELNVFKFMIIADFIQSVNQKLHTIL